MVTVDGRAFDNTLRFRSIRGLKGARPRIEASEGGFGRELSLYLAAGALRVPQ
jgi:hypothetical protein